MGVYPAGDAGLDSLSAEEFDGVTLRTEPLLVCVQTPPPLPSVKIAEGPVLRFLLRGGCSVHKLSLFLCVCERRERGALSVCRQALEIANARQPMCEHLFIDKSMVITEPAVLSAWLLCLESKLQQAAHAQQRSYLTDSCTVFLEYAKIA